MTTNLRAWFIRHAAIPLFLTIAGGLVAAGFAAQEAPAWAYKVLIMNWGAIPLPARVEARDAMASGHMTRWQFTAIYRDMEDSPMAIILNDPKGLIKDARGDLTRLVDDMNKGAVKAHVVFASDEPNRPAILRGADGCKYVGRITSPGVAAVSKRGCTLAPDGATVIYGPVRLEALLPRGEPGHAYPSEEVTMFPGGDSA